VAPYPFLPGSTITVTSPLTTTVTYGGGIWSGEVAAGSVTTRNVKRSA
jgi:hypothetical protein